MNHVDALHRLADVVEELEGTALDVDDAHVIDWSDGELAARLTVTAPAGGDLGLGRDRDRGADETDAVVQAPGQDYIYLEESDDEGEGEGEGEGEEPADDADAEALDHTSTADLERAYEAADGNIADAAERFEVSYATVYQRMCDHGVHKVGNDGDADGDSGGRSEASEGDLEEVYADDDDDEQLVEDDADADADGGDDRDRDHDPAVDEACPWLERPADEIVDTNPNCRRDLDEVLNYVETAETVIDVHQRLSPDRLRTTKDLLWELGLRDPDVDTMLLEEPKRSERIAALREVFVDE